MATLQQKIDALDTYLESASGLEINCIKGYPDFRQPGITTPLAALFYGGSQARADGVRKRIGASPAALVLTLGVYASNEVNLFSLAEKLQTLREARPELTAGSGGSAEKIKIYLGDDERQPPDAEDVKEIRHFISCPVVLAYE